MSRARGGGWSRGAVAAAGLAWPGAALDLVAPDGLFEEIGLDETVAVLNRLARALSEQSTSTPAGTSMGQADRTAA